MMWLRRPRRRRRPRRCFRCPRSPTDHQPRRSLSRPSRSRRPSTRRRGEPVDEHAPKRCNSWPSQQGVVPSSKLWLWTLSRCTPLRTPFDSQQPHVDDGTGVSMTNTCTPMLSGLARGAQAGKPRGKRGPGDELAGQPAGFVAGSFGSGRCGRQLGSAACRFVAWPGRGQPGGHPGGAGVPRPAWTRRRPNRPGHGWATAGASTPAKR